MFSQPPYSSCKMIKAMTDNQGNRKAKLHPVTKIPAHVGLPLRLRFCANCGQLLLHWGQRMLNAAQVPQPEPENRFHLNQGA